MVEAGAAIRTRVRPGLFEGVGAARAIRVASVHAHVDLDLRAAPAGRTFNLDSPGMPSRLRRPLSAAVDQNRPGPAATGGIPGNRVFLRASMDPVAGGAVAGSNQVPLDEPHSPSFRIDRVQERA